jgi:AraC-like DNA-binding protein
MVDAMDPVLSLACAPALQVAGCGLFVSPGSGRHEERILDTWELVIVERGRLGIAVADRAYDLGKGGWLLLPAGIRHAGTREFAADLRFAWMHFRPVSGPGLDLPDHGHVADLAPVSALVRRLLDHQAAGPQNELILALHLQLILAELIAAPATNAPRTEVAARARKLIQLRHVEPDLDVALIARALGVSSDYLARQYRAAYGTTITAAIHQARIAEAKRLLALGNLTVETAAAAAGFRDAQWFRRLFQRYAGVSPRAWRRLHARGHVNRR